MVNLWGPGAYGSARPSAARPALVPANGALDAEDFFKDCTSPEARDGTEWRSGLLNALIVNMRSYARKSGVPISNLDDDLMTRAGRRGFNYVVAGGTANALTAALDPAPVAGEIADGFRLLLNIASTNTGPATLNAGDGAVAIQSPSGGALVAGDLTAATIVPVIRRGAVWRMVAFSINQIKATLSGYVEKAPAGRALQTVQGSVAVESTSAANVALTVVGTPGSANPRESYVGGTKIETLTSSGILEIQGSAQAFQMAVSSVVWKNSADANNWTLSRNGNRVFTFGQAVGLSSAYTGQLDCSSNGLAIAVPNVNSLFAFLSFQHSGGGIFGTVTGNPAVGTVAYNTTSDERLKDVIGPADYEPGLVKRLSIVWFRWKAIPDGSPQRGALAQEVYLIWPEAVTVGRGEPGDADFIAWSIDWSKLVPLLILEAQETDRRLDAIEAHIAAGTSKAPTADIIRATVERRTAIEAMSDAERDEKLKAASAQSPWVDAQAVLRAQEEADRVFREQFEAERAEQDERNAAAFAASDIERLAIEIPARETAEEPPPL